MGRPPYGARTACESCKSIDVRRWHRDGCLAPGQHFSRSWSYYGGEPTDIDTINVATEADAVMLTYWTSLGRDAALKPVNQRVAITWTDCRFGGRRPWFVCSVYSDGQYCGPRVAVLYGAGNYFACRHCYGLAYETQQQSPRWRGFTKARKIRMRVGGNLNLLEPFPEKPLHMHWRTYERLYRAYEVAKTRSIEGIWGLRSKEHELR
jgi:hypothetical protein